MVAALVGPMVREQTPDLHPVDRVIAARRAAAGIPAASGAEKSQLFDELAALAQESAPVVDLDGRTAKAVVFPEIANIFLEAVQADELVESVLLGERYRLRGPENEPARREIAQRTFAAIPEALRSYRGEAGVKSYVLGIVANHYRNWVREAAKDRDLTDLPEDDRLVGASLRSSLLLNKIEIGRAMADLAPKHREIIELAYFEGLSAADVQAALDLSGGQYRNRRRQALKELAELLEERGHGY